MNLNDFIKKNRILTMGLISMLLISATCLATLHVKQLKVTGIYSSLKFNEESGDVIGEELIVVFTKRGYVVIFQNSEGEPNVPLVAISKVNNNVITFTLPSPLNRQGEFTGEIFKDKLIGKFENSEKPLILIRKKAIGSELKNASLSFNIITGAVIKARRRDDISRRMRLGCERIEGICLFAESCFRSGPARS